MPRLPFTDLFSLFSCCVAPRAMHGCSHSVGVTAGATSLQQRSCSITAQKSTQCPYPPGNLRFNPKESNRIAWTKCASHQHSRNHSALSRGVCQLMFFRAPASTCPGHSGMQYHGAGLQGWAQWDAEYLLKPVRIEGPYSLGLYVRTWCNRKKEPLPQRW